MHTVYLSQKWTKLERPEGAPWPVERSSHAACCLNYGEEHPQLLVTGGTDKIGNILQDAWTLDVKSGRWREVIGDVQLIQLLRIKTNLLSCYGSRQILPNSHLCISKRKN